MAKKKVSKKKPKIPDEVKKYNMAKEIRNHPFAGQNDVSDKAHKFIRENSAGVTKNKLIPGQLVLFNYFKPKTKEELQYYDATPCTLIFGTMHTEEGKRYIGFNIHYYPPKIRARVISKIYDIFKKFYQPRFKNGVVEEVTGMSYKSLLRELKSAKLDFGVRMYIPQLINRSFNIAPENWKTAVYTEGNFKKETIEAIMEYWKRFKK